MNNNSTDEFPWFGVIIMLLLFAAPFVGIAIISDMYDKKIHNMVVKKCLPDRYIEYQITPDKSYLVTCLDKQNNKKYILVENE